MLKHLLAALITLAATPSVASVPPRSPYCGASVVRDYSLGVTYFAMLRRVPSCTASQTTRVRKVSTMNLGYRYAPIKPLRGAWVMTDRADGVPPGEHWTLYSWRWQWWDGVAWVFMEVQ